ncbi:uncharacterized protein LOC112458019 isoform X4 [Temnothorax curvispinosus]|uniref:Uncharacterized protein LOC112458019 isoform X4 n=1 Tax=Temnothorax curvispinosus TaxID=300111 RepID=A0A6J1Q4P8_9HYME|nr:uncharacterized protein LOC112458019 isoform X4 [Temnothorax curvispinosus]
MYENMEITDILQQLGISTYANVFENEEDASTSQDTFLLETIPSIEDLLQRSKTGRVILCGSKIKELTGSMRNKLCNIIITYMQDNNLVMTNEIAKGISKRIVKLFPSEAEGTYFIEGKKKDPQSG